MIPREICPQCNWKREMVDGKLVCPKCGSSPHRRPRARYGEAVRVGRLKAEKGPQQPCQQAGGLKEGGRHYGTKKPVQLSLFVDSTGKGGG